MRERKIQKKRGDKVPRTVRFLFIGILLAIGLGFAFRLSYSSLKIFRGRKLAAEVAVLLRDGKFAEALPALRVANQLAPFDPSVIRVRAIYSMRTGLVSAVSDWQQLLAENEVTLDDKINALESTLIFRRPDLADSLFKELAPMALTNAQVLDLGIQHLANNGLIERAIYWAQIAFQNEPQNQTNQLQFGALLLQSTNDLSRQRGRELVNSIAMFNPSLKSNAFSLLIRYGAVNKEIAPILLASLSLSPVNLTNSINDLELRWIAYPDDQKEIIASAESRIKSETDPKKLTILCEWLLKKNSSALLRALSESKVDRPRNLDLIEAEALATSLQWAKLQDVLKRPSTNISEFHRSIFRARLAIAETRQSEAASLFINAMNQSSGNPESLVYTARLAEQANLLDTAFTIWTKISKLPSLTGPASEELLRLARGKDRLDIELAALTLKCNVLSTDKRIKAEKAILESILGVNLKEARLALESYLANTTRKTEQKFLSALALIHFLQGDATTAQSIFNQEQRPEDQLTDHDRVVQVLISGAVQHREMARKIALKINLSSLSTQERKLIASWL